MLLLGIGAEEVQYLATQARWLTITIAIFKRRTASQEMLLSR
jgi:hypothetical protein